MRQGAPTARGLDAHLHGLVRGFVYCNVMRHQRACYFDGNPEHVVNDSLALQQAPCAEAALPGVRGRVSCCSWRILVPQRYPTSDRLHAWWLLALRVALSRIISDSELREGLTR